MLLTKNGTTVASELHSIQTFCRYLPDTSIFPAIICCRLYSHTRMAPLTWTFSERITPCCGISTHTSSRLIKSAGIPSFSFLYKTHSNSDKSGRKRGKYLPHVNNLYDYIKLDWVITRVRAAFWWGIWSRSVIHC